MKKYLLFIAVIFLSFKGYSQCTPDGSITKAGIYPDSATNLPHAVVGVPYSTVMQLRAPKDTNATIGGFPVNLTVDSIVLQSFTGFPPGYTYTCVPARCSFAGNTNGCVLIQGPAPSIAQVGMVYHLTAVERAYLHITGTTIPIDTPSTLSYYFIQVDNNSGVSMIAGSRFSVAQNHPNPFNKSTMIEFYSPASGTISLSVSNMLGKTLSTKSVKVLPGNNKITLSAKDFDPGIYFYTITSDKQSVTKRMIVDNE